MEKPLEPPPHRAFNLNLFFIKLDRIAAWILLAVILAYAVTGYGLTKGLINRETARSLHLAWLAGIGLAAFIIHTAHAVSLAFRRWHIWNRYSRFCLIVFYILLAAFFIYIHFFYTSSERPTAAGNNTFKYGAAQNITNVQNAATSALPVFTSATLAVYNGLNGQPAYAAVNDLVYDFSSLFRNGRHEGHSAGQDISAAFNGIHPDSYLLKYEVVGIYQK